MIYFVLSDNSTYDANGFLAVLTQRGNEELSEALDFKSVSEDEIVSEISLNDLIEAYNLIHGTDY